MRGARQRDVGRKPRLRRHAEVEGRLSLSAATRRAIRGRRVEKGDPIGVGEIAGLAAMKRTSELIPHCHIVPLSSSAVEISLTPSGVRARATAEAVDRTGVEMEALVGATVALLTVWDMVKYLEKDDTGNYPTATLGPVRVVRKTKAPEAA